MSLPPGSSSAHFNSGSDAEVFVPGWTDDPTSKAACESETKANEGTAAGKITYRDKNTYASDACLTEDSKLKVACETAFKVNEVTAAGGITNQADIDREELSDAVLDACSTEVPKVAGKIATHVDEAKAVGEITCQDKIDYEEFADAVLNACSTDDPRSNAAREIETKVSEVLAAGGITNQAKVYRASGACSSDGSLLAFAA